MPRRFLTPPLVFEEPNLWEKAIKRYCDGRKHNQVLTSACIFAEYEKNKDLKNLYMYCYVIIIKFYHYIINLIIIKSLGAF